MMKQLDVALQEYTNQQQKSDQVHYVAKVQSRTTSRRYSNGFLDKSSFEL